MVGRNSQFIFCFAPVILSLFLRNLLAQPDKTVLQAIVSGLRNGWSDEKQYYTPGEVIELVIFGENMDQSIMGDIFLTDAGRCGDVDILSKQKIAMIPDSSYPDLSSIIVKSKNPVESDLRAILRLCTSKMDKHQIPPHTSWIYPEPEDEYFIPLPFLALAFGITLFTSACLSGLNLAYSVLSLEQLHMLANKKTGSPADQKKSRHAQRVLPLRKRSNWLIATFAIGNTIVNIMSTLIAEEMFSKLAAKVILVNTVPVIMTMLFGEILPQAICNKRALSVASNLRIVVILMMGIFCIFAWPLSRLLDCILGKEPIRVYDLKQLSIILEEHGANKEILGNVMRFPTLKIGKIMTRIQDAYLLSRNDVLDMNRMIGILEKGYTRVPVYAELDRKKIVAVLNVKDLILIDPDQKIRVSEFLKHIAKFTQSQTAEIRFVSCDSPAQDVMNEMAHGKHLMMVFRFDNKVYHVVGLVTLEDIIEEFIGEIKDDDDAAFPTMRAGYRRDQSTFDWFRDETDKKTGLNANGMLKLIQQILEHCPIFGNLNINVSAMRALVHVSEIELVEKKSVIEKGALIKCLYVIVSGDVAKDGVQVKTERPVFGNELLEELYHRISVNTLTDKLKDDEIQIIYDSEISLLSPRATVLKISLNDICNILKAFDSEKMAEETLNQFDHYIHALAFMGTVPSDTSRQIVMHASMEDPTQNAPGQSPANVKVIDVYEMTAIGTEIAQGSAIEKKDTKPLKKAAAKGKAAAAVVMDPKREQQTQQLLEHADSNSKKSKVSKKESNSKKSKKSKVSKRSARKKQKSKSRTPPTITTAPIAAADDETDTVAEDKTQASLTKPLLDK